MNLLVEGEADECVIMLINAIPGMYFTKFIDEVINKRNLSSELCWCEFKNLDDYEYYHFETFMDDIYEISYSDFIEIIKLAIIRYYIGTCDERKILLKEYVKNTIFDSILDNIDSSMDSGIPLVYG